MDHSADAIRFCLLDLVGGSNSRSFKWNAERRFLELDANPDQLYQSPADSDRILEAVGGGTAELLAREIHSVPVAGVDFIGGHLFYSALASANLRVTAAFLGARGPWRGAFLSLLLHL